MDEDLADFLKKQAEEKQAKTDHVTLRRLANKTKLTVLLAEGGLSKDQLATKFGVSKASITRFAKEFFDDIEHYKFRLAQTAKDMYEPTLWIHNQMDRLAQYQQCFEDLEAQVILDTANNRRVDTGLIKTKLQALRNVAEELGQIQPKMTTTIDAPIVTFTIDGVDMSALH